MTLSGCAECAAPYLHALVPLGGADVGDVEVLEAGVDRGGGRMVFGLRRRRGRGRGELDKAISFFLFSYEICNLLERFYIRGLGWR